jgi:hypothetical protein
VATSYNSEKKNNLEKNKKQTIPISWPRDVTQKFFFFKNAISFPRDTTKKKTKKNPYLVATSYNSEKNKKLLSRSHELQLRKKQKFAILLSQVNLPISFLFYLVDSKSFLSLPSWQVCLLALKSMRPSSILLVS